MSARGFKPIVMVASVFGAALGCYMVSLKVASERAQLEEVETGIVLAQRDIRLLETEIGTRGRLAQLERWNAKVIRLSAPAEDQFVNSGFQLAALVAPDHANPVEAPVVLASAPAVPREAPVVSDDGPAPMPATPPAAATGARDSLGRLLHTASYTAPTPSVALPRVAADKPKAPAVSAGAEKPVAARPVAAKATKPATAGTSAVKPGTKAPAGTKATAAAKSVKTAMADPLAPLPKGGAKAKAAQAGPSRSSPPTKDPGSRR